MYEAREHRTVALASVVRVIIAAMVQLYNDPSTNTPAMKLCKGALLISQGSLRFSGCRQRVSTPPPGLSMTQRAGQRLLSFPLGTQEYSNSTTDSAAVWYSRAPLWSTILKQQLPGRQIDTVCSVLGVPSYRTRSTRRGSR